MPPRNAIVLSATIFLSLVCYAKSTRNQYARLVAEGMAIVSRNALEEVKPRQLFEDAMSGMLHKLDRYSTYIPPAEFEPFQEVLDQEFGGIGIYLDTNPDNDQLTVLSPVAGAPAYRAGVRAGDHIVAIDGVLTAELKRDEAASRMRGKPGTTVRLTVRHVGAEQTQDIDVQRAIIEVPSVLGDTRDGAGNWNFVLEQEPRIAYIRIVSFGEKTVGETKQALASLPGNIEALILDVRNNTGGLLSAAVDICDLFLDEGVVVTTRGRDSSIRSQYEATAGVVIEPHIPMAVLANRFSASASEIVAACLQDHQRAVVVGERTWGKGTVQNVYPLEAGRSAIKLTVASYWRPSNENIHRPEGAQDEDIWGVRPSPDCELTLTDEQFQATNLARARRDILTLPPAATNHGDSAAAADAVGGNGATTPVAAELAEDLQLRKAVEVLKRQLTEAR